MIATACNHEETANKSDLINTEPDATEAEQETNAEDITVIDDGQVAVVADMRDYYVANLNDYFEINGVAIRDIATSEVARVLSNPDYETPTLTFFAYSEEGMLGGGR